MSALRKELKNQDTHYLAESVFTVRRDDQSMLIKWTLFFMGMMKYCLAASITLPVKLYYQMFIGQVAPSEIKHVVYACPKSEEECDAFSFDDYRDKIKSLSTTRQVSTVIAEACERFYVYDAGLTKDGEN